MQGRHHVRAWTPHVRAHLTSAPRIIGIDGSRATAGLRTGTERYSAELLAAIANLEPPERFRVYVNAASRPTDLRAPGDIVAIPGTRLWTLRKLSAEMRRDPPDLLFVPAHVIPPLHPTSVVTIHDLGYLVEPGCHPPFHRKQLQLTTRWTVRTAAGLIAVSESTKRDLMEFLDVDPERIVVIHHGVARTMAPASDSAIATVRSRYGIGSRAILAVGTIHPRKNIVRLIQAFERLAAHDPELQLVLCGAPGWNSDRILRRASDSPFHRRILHLGYVPDSELSALYSATAVLAFPSLYEGFGMPALEAMSCGAPVVAADRSALPEVCGDAALLVDPFDAAAIEAGIQRVLTDSDLRTNLIQRGIHRTQEFSWETCAEQTLAFLRFIGDN